MIRSYKFVIVAVPLFLMCLVGCKKKSTEVMDDTFQLEEIPVEETEVIVEHVIDFDKCKQIGILQSDGTVKQLSKEETKAIIKAFKSAKYNYQRSNGPKLKMRTPDFSLPLIVDNKESQLAQIWDYDLLYIYPNWYNFSNKNEIKSILGKYYQENK